MFIAKEYIDARNFSLYTFKKDKNFKQLWRRRFEPKRYDEFKKIKSVKDGYIVIGKSSVHLGPGHNGDPGGLILKYDKEGNQEWGYNYCNSNFWCYFEDVIETELGYIVVGHGYQEETASSGTGNTGRDFWSPYVGLIVSFDFDGNIKNVTEFKGSRQELLYAITATEDGYVVAGTSSSTDAGFENEGGPNEVLLKYVDPELLKVKLEKKLEVLKPLIDKDDEESEKFYEETKKNKDKYDKEELKKKIKETDALIEKLKNKDDKVKNPDTGIVGYGLLLIMIILLSIYGLNYKKKYL